LRRDGLDGLWVSLGIGKLAGAVDGDKHVELAFFCPYCGNINVEVAERRGLERLLLRLVTCRIWQAADAMPLKATVQRRSCQVRLRGLQGIQAVIE
jgi:hypothetical protein